jgi:23S rRNA pseudouridine1911/1915/1917 synthase
MHMQTEFDFAIEYLVTETDELSRLDKFVTILYPQYSRTLIQKIIKSESMLVNGKATKANYVVRVNDLIQITEIPFTEMDLLPEPIPLDIVYEDDDVLVVNKPSGMVVHPAPGNYEHTLVNGLLYHINQLSEGSHPLRPGIVHRIDKDTSGLLMVAKNDLSHRILADELKNKVTKREYIALVMGNIGNSSGKIDAPIGRDLKDRKRMAITVTGKSAITHFTVIERFANTTLVRCILETGRTHQIRVHMAYIGHPVMGDPIYGKKANSDEEGQFLHAAVLGFTHPKSGIFMEFSSDLPPHFQEVLNDFRTLS